MNQQLPASLLQQLLGQQQTLAPTTNAGLVNNQNLPAVQQAQSLHNVPGIPAQKSTPMPKQQYFSSLINALGGAKYNKSK